MPPRASDVWVGLLARRCRPSGPAAASPSPAFDGRVVVRSGVLTHSGGTAPDSHRTSLLCPSWAPRQGRVLYHSFRLAGVGRYGFWDGSARAWRHGGQRQSSYLSFSSPSVL